MAQRSDRLVEILGDPDPFLDEVFAGIDGAGISMANFSQIDHMCYRTVSDDNYRQKQEELREIARLLGETPVNGRLISTFLLHEPYRYKHWRIDAIELPAPKEGSTHQEGLEHIECVLHDADLEGFAKRHSDLDFDTKAIDRGVNPELGLSLGRYSVKFHIVSLPAAIWLENKFGITEVNDGQ